jgi:hypothetical protein
VVVEPVDVVQGRGFDVLDGAPWPWVRGRRTARY